MFTLENTNGYTQAQLDKMNAELKEALKGVEPDSDNYKQMEKIESDRIFNKYC